MQKSVQMLQTPKTESSQIRYANPLHYNHFPVHKQTHFVKSFAESNNDIPPKTSHKNLKKQSENSNNHP